MELTSHYFDVFDLPISYNIDLRVLKLNYLALQKQFHPDRVAGGSAQQQRIAVQSAAFLNQAYEVLVSPVKRGQYLLELAGVEADSSDKTNSDIDFLMAQMSLREQMADVPDSADPFVELEALTQKVKIAITALENEFSVTYENNALDKGRAVLEKLQFFSKLKIELLEMEERLEEDL